MQGQTRLFSIRDVMFNVVALYGGVLEIYGDVETDKGRFNLYIEVVDIGKDFAIDEGTLRIILAMISEEAGQAWPDADIYIWEGTYAQQKINARVCMIEGFRHIRIVVGKTR